MFCSYNRKTLKGMLPGIYRKHGFVTKQKSRTESNESAKHLLLLLSEQDEHYNERENHGISTRKNKKFRCLSIEVEIVSEFVIFEDVFSDCRSIRPRDKVFQSPVHQKCRIRDQFRTNSHMCLIHELTGHMDILCHMRLGHYNRKTSSKLSKCSTFARNSSFRAISKLPAKRRGGYSVTELQRLFCGDQAEVVEFRDEFSGSFCSERIFRLELLDFSRHFPHFSGQLVVSEKATTLFTLLAFWQLN